MIEPVEKIAMKIAIFCKKKLPKRKKKHNITKNVFHFNCSFQDLDHQNYLFYNNNEFTNSNNNYNEQMESHISDYMKSMEKYL